MEKLLLFSFLVIVLTRCNSAALTRWKSRLIMIWHTTLCVRILMAKFGWNLTSGCGNTCFFIVLCFPQASTAETKKTKYRPMEVDCGGNKCIDFFYVLCGSVVCIYFPRNPSPWDGIFSMWFSVLVVLYIRKLERLPLLIETSKIDQNMLASRTHSNLSFKLTTVNLHPFLVTKSWLKKYDKWAGTE